MQLQSGLFVTPDPLSFDEHALPSDMNRRDQMSQFRELQEFEKRFDSMGVAELKRWQTYWIRHAQLLAPKVRKQAMKRVHRIERAIEARSQHGDRTHEYAE